MIRWWQHSEKGVTDRQTDRQTENTICRAAWSQLKKKPGICSVRYISQWWWWKVYTGIGSWEWQLEYWILWSITTHSSLDCFTLLLARHLADVSCYIGPSMPSGIFMEIHTEIVQKRKKKPSHNKGVPRQPHVYWYIDQSYQRLEEPITNLDRNILRGHQRT